MSSMKKLSRNFFVGLFLALCPLQAFAQGINPAFNPNILIPNAVFSDAKTFGGAAEIQKFLEQKGSELANTSAEFLLKLREPDDALLKEKLEDPRPNLSRPRTAAELIWDSSQASGLNPQVIIVTLNKEQSLITGKHAANDLQRALNHSMGFACPDDGGCEDTLSGFYFQLFGNFDASDNRYIGAPKSLMKSFNTSGGRGPYGPGGKIVRVGETVTLTNTIGGFEGVKPEQDVTIGNLATAALYRYTPHVFNGNYNFWRFFTTWFRYPNGTILKSVESNIYYVVQKGQRRQLPVFVAQALKMNLKKAITASPTELNNYPLGAIYQPAGNTIVSLNGKFYLFIGGVRHPVTKFVLEQKNLKPGKALRVTEADLALYAEGPQLLPKDGTVLRVKRTNNVYLVSNGALKLFGALALKQYDARKKALAVSANDIATYPKIGYVAPKDGTLVRTMKDKNAIYIMRRGEKLPLPRALFVNLKYKTNDIKTIGDVELQSFSTGKNPTPRNGTYFKVAETGELFLFKNRTIHAITPEVAKKRKLKFNSRFSSDMVKDWTLGAPVK